MERAITNLLIAFVLTVGGSTCLIAQTLSADSFLNSVAAHPVGDEVERDRSGMFYQSLNSAPPTEIERVLPTVLLYTRSGNEVHVRLYATLFLTAIAIRPDGAALLSARSGEISSLIIDPVPGVQRGALAVADYVIGKAGTENQPYLSALQTAIQETQTPQDATEQMIETLLPFRGNDPGVLRSVLTFMQRDDLTRSTRINLVRHLGLVSALPTEVYKALTKELDDPDAWVRAAAVGAFADSTNQFYTTEFHTLAKDRVARMANDPQENAQVRELAKEAIAGKTHLNPNIDLPPEDRKDH